MLIRLLADFLHVLSLLVLVRKIWQSKSCLGISCKTQELYLFVFLARYLDSFTYFVSLYYICMKITFTGLTAYLVYLMRMSRIYKQTYDKKGDSFNYWLWLFPPCLMLALLFTAEYSLIDYLWTFSIVLEAVAFIPQLHMLRKMKEVENMTSHYVFCLGAYRLLYLIDWTWSTMHYRSVPWVAICAGLVQSALYADFFYYYMKAKFSMRPTVAI